MFNRQKSAHYKPHLKGFVHFYPALLEPLNVFISLWFSWLTGTSYGSPMETAPVGALPGQRVSRPWAGAAEALGWAVWAAGPQQRWTHRHCGAADRTVWTRAVQRLCREGTLRPGLRICSQITRRYLSPERVFERIIPPLIHFCSELINVFFSRDLGENFVIALIKTLNMIRLEDLWGRDLPPCCLYGGSFWVLG